MLWRNRDQERGIRSVCIGGVAVVSIFKNLAREGLMEKIIFKTMT